MIWTSTKKAVTTMRVYNTECLQMVCFMYSYPWHSCHMPEPGPGLWHQQTEHVHTKCSIIMDRQQNVMLIVFIRY